MKKIIKFVTVLTLAATMVAPMTAFADTTLQDADNSFANTTVKFNVKPSYTVTIPPDVKVRSTMKQLNSVP
ncbi:MAG: hypothetical protein J1E56_01345 [Ruminococcus sp.]|nr:hypothetical protein [Ruminococcus sp.]